ncbi:MAG TPA: hypothetical protein VGY52_13890 [Roseiarcus sp.]|jgi:hypothetical protein|nr:hypothetical protein [Roseiarcus sp.]
MKLSLSTKALGALAGAAFLTASMSAPASAFTLSSPSISEPFSAGQVDKVWWHHGYWHPGWGHGWHHRDCWWTYWGWRCGW